MLRTLYLGECLGDLAGKFLCVVELHLSNLSGDLEGTGEFVGSCASLTGGF